jgi:hypothetical protein
VSKHKRKQKNVGRPGKAKAATPPPKATVLETTSHAEPVPLDYPTAATGWTRKLRQAAQSTWAPIVGISTLVTIGSLFVWLRPDISIEPDSSAVSNPLSAGFRFQNKEPFAIHSVSFACELLKVTTMRHGTIMHEIRELQPASVIESGESATRQCPLGAPLLAEDVTKAEVIVAITYSQVFRPGRRAKSEYFVGVFRRKDGWIWTHQPLQSIAVR